MFSPPSQSAHAATGELKDAGLFDSRASLASTVDSSHDAIVSKALNGIRWNDSVAQICGYTANEIISQSILVLIPLQPHQDEDQILGKVRTGERIDHYEGNRMRKWREGSGLRHDLFDEGCDQ